MYDKKQPSPAVIAGGVLAAAGAALGLYYLLKNILFGKTKLFRPYVNMNSRDYLYYHKLDFIMVKWIKSLMAQNRVEARKKAVLFCGESCIDTHANNVDLYSAAKNVVYSEQALDLIKKYLKGRIDSKKKDYFLSKYGAMLSYMKTTYATSEGSINSIAPVLKYVQERMIDNETSSGRDSEVWFNEGE